MVAVVVAVVSAQAPQSKRVASWRALEVAPVELNRTTPTRTHDTMHTTVQNLMARASSAAPHLSLMSGHLSQPEKTTAGHQNTQ